MVLEGKMHHLLAQLVRGLAVCRASRIESGSDSMRLRAQSTCRPEPVAAPA